MLRIPKARKEAILNKMMSPYPPTIAALLKQEGISEATLYSWRKQLRQEGPTVPEHDRTSESWSAQTKFAVVVETAAMTEIELAEYCRSRGLYSDQVKAWRDTAIASQVESQPATAASQQQGRDYRKQIKRLETDLGRKEKALAEAAALLILQKRCAPSGRGRGRMTSLLERQRIIGNIDEACNSGATLHRSCHIVGISLNCWYRWQQDSTVLPDLRPESRRGAPANKLTVEERSAILDVCNSARLGSLPPSQIVPLLADEGRYVASESSFYRVLREAGQAYRRGRAASARIASKPTSYTATAPNQVWSWNVTSLPSSVKGQFYKLYLIEDIFSRFPVGWEVHDEETGELAAELVQRSVLAQRCANRPLVLHSDNGAPMKSYTLKA